MLTVTAFTKYGSAAASTRQRLLQYVPALNAAGIEIDYRPLLPNEYVACLSSGSTFPRGRIVSAYCQRLRQVIFEDIGEVVWVYAELFPWLPAVFERILIHRRIPLIYDMDDAFFHAYDDNRNPLIRNLLGRKLQVLMSAANACTCGNTYLRDYAARFCSETQVFPTVVNTEIYKPGEQKLSDRPLTIGWIGSPSTWKYVRPLLPLLSELCTKHKVVFRAVGAGIGAVADRFPHMELGEWSEETEVPELQRFDLGIMPVVDDPWGRGKSGYKLIQYMACGVPVVASPVGVNCDLINDHENGFLAATVGEWRDAIERLLGDSDLRASLGQAGRTRATAEFSLGVYSPRLIEMIRSAAGG